MLNNNREIENAWSMLQYLYVELRSKRFKDIDITSITSLDNLYAFVIAKWCTNIANEGLYKEYITHEAEEMTSPQGQVNIQESISRQTMSRGMLVCDYDELSGNNYMNHILKCTLQYILYLSNIDKEVRNEVITSLQMFNGVDLIDINNIHWRSIKYNNSNIRYKHLIEMCNQFIVEHSLIRSINLSDGQRLYILFKKQILLWWTKHYSDENNVSIIEYNYTLDNEPMYETRFYKKQRIVAVKNNKKAVLICVRIQNELLIDDQTLGKKHINELVEYIRNYKKEYKLVTAGCLVYINIDKSKINLQPITVNNIKDFMVGETIIDLHDQWRFIENKLNDIYKYFLAKK